MSSAGTELFPGRAGEKPPQGVEAGGPTGNTGQKGQQREHGAIVDFLTVVFPASVLADQGVSRLHHLLGTLFGFRGEVVTAGFRERRWHFYSHSATLLDRDGQTVGKVGIGGNGDSVCVELSGGGCRWVSNWHTTAHEVARLGGRITHCDLAYDDYDGQLLNVHAMRERARAGEFAENGRPPKFHFLDDEGHGTGSTLYVGSRGHKQFCCYEKGKQLGLPASPWVRAEVRLYAKHLDGRSLPVEVLTAPLRYLRGAYAVLRCLPSGVCSRLKTVKATAAATGEAMFTWLRTQCGKALHLVGQLAGGDPFALSELVADRIARPGTPGRFRNIEKGDALIAMLRSELCLVS